MILGKFEWSYTCKLVEHGPLIWPTVEENGVIRTKKYVELSAAEKIQVDCDMKATNIILQGFPADIYSLVNHHRVAKDLWERVQLLMQGTCWDEAEREFLPPEWSKFVTDVKLVKDLHTSNFDQLHAYLEQHELHANEVRIMRERNQDPLAFVANQQMTPPHFNPYQSSYNNPQLQQQFSPTQHFAILVFSPRDDPIACLNKAMAFLTAVASSRFPTTNNQLRTSSNPRNQATIQDGRVTVQQVQGRQGQNYSGNTYKGNATSSRGNTASGQARVVKCYNCQGEGHMARQCTQPKRPRNAAWYKEKAMLAEAQEAGQILDEEQLAFLADPGILASQVQIVIPHNAAFQTKDLDTYDSDCDDLSTTQTVLMANISNYGSNIVSEVHNSETYLNDMDNQSVHALQDFEQSPVVDFTDKEISSDSNLIPYSQYLQETQQATVQDTNLQAQQDSMILSMIEQMSEQMINHVNNLEKANKEQNNESITAELERYKERVKTFEQRLNVDLSNREKMIDSQMDDMIREKCALKEQIDSLEQNLSKQIKEKESVLQSFAVFKIESKEKEDKYMENEIDLEKKIKELDNIVFKVGQSAQTVHMLTKPQAFYDNVHKQALGYQNPFYLRKAQRIKPTLYDGIVISTTHVAMPVNDDEETLILEEIAKKEILLENDRLLQKIMSQDVMLTVMNFMPLNNDSVNMMMQKCDSCEMCLNLGAELSKSKQAYNNLLKNHSQLEKHCIFLKVSMQLKQEVFQNDESFVSQNAVEIPEYFVINDLKAQLQDKDTTICKLKDTIKSLRKNTKEENVNHDKCDLEPINEELENSVAKLLSENERLCNEINHVKQVFKDQFDSIKQTRVRHKEQCDSLINKLNLKSVENEDLKAQIQDKVFVITSLKNDLRKTKGKEIVENVVQIPSVTTIAPGMFKLDLEPLPPRLLKNREIHSEYLRNTQEQANILRGLVEQVKAKQPLDGDLDLACKYTTRIQELLVYVQDTCPNAITPSSKKIVVTSMNKKFRFAEPLTSSSNSKQVESSNSLDSNTPVLSSTGVKCSTSNCGSKPSGNKKNDMISQKPRRNKKNNVEAQPRKVNKKNRVVKPVCDVDVKHSLLNANSDILYASCNKSMFDGVHDKCLLDLVQNKNKRSKSAKKHKKQNVWKPTGHVFTEVGLKWKPTGKTFTIVGNLCPLTRITSTNVVPPKQTTSNSAEIQKPEIKVYSRKPKNVRNIGSSKIAKIVESKNANHSEPNQTWRSNATDIPSSSSLVMTDCPDYTLVSGLRMFQTHDRESLSAHELCVQLTLLGNVVISRVYYVEGLDHNLFSVGQFCDADLEVAFQKNPCFICNLEGVDLLSGSRDTNLYTISHDDMLKSSPICLLSKASKTRSWLWHRRLSHLNFGTLNKLAKDGLAQGIPRLKFQKDHLCSACALGKSKKTSH
ncbi:retrovirus-related pol polyprotein from transposon TNT 1-94 [Tanacetum coccineum]